MRPTRRQFLGLVAGAGLAGCATAPRGIALATPNRGPFTFAAIGDLHVLDAQSTGIVGRAVDMVNANTTVDFTVIVGDLATAGRSPELNFAHKTLRRLARPWYVLPGNHDVTMGAPDIYANYHASFGKADWKAGDGDWLFLGIDSCNEDKSDVAIRPDQIQWLGKTLENANPRGPIALFSHHPFNPHSKAYRVKNADDVLALFKNHNLKLVAAGHFHGNQVEEQDGVLFTTTACCSSTRGNHDGTKSKGFRLFHVDKEAIKTEYVEVSA